MLRNGAQKWVTQESRLYEFAGGTPALPGTTTENNSKFASAYHE